VGFGGVWGVFLLGLCCFLGFGHVRTPCIQPVYLGAPYAFSIKFYVTYQKKKSEIVLGHKID
jgi:hypothetical protein